MTKKKDQTTQELEEKIAELENSWKRALADYQNLEKRVIEERKEYIGFANRILISKLINVLDSLEILNKHTDDEGIKLIVKEFKQILSDEGLEEIKTEGEDFNMLVMEAAEMVEGESGKVIEVISKGYKLKDKVIRPAKVKVGLGKKED
jgi:molecular chaperone GrpE